MEKRVNAHEKRETPSSTQISSFLMVSSFFCFTGRHCNVHLSSAVNARARKCEITSDERNKARLEWARVPQIDRFYTGLCSFLTAGHFVQKAGYKTIFAVRKR